MGIIFTCTVSYDVYATTITLTEPKYAHSAVWREKIGYILEKFHRYPSLPMLSCLVWLHLYIFSHVVYINGKGLSLLF